MFLTEERICLLHKVQSREVDRIEHRRHGDWSEESLSQLRANDLFFLFVEVNYLKNHLTSIIARIVLWSSFFAISRMTTAGQSLSDSIYCNCVFSSQN